MSSNVLQPNPPYLTSPHHTSHTNTTTTPPNDTFPQMPLFCNPPKNPHLHHYFFVSLKEPTLHLHTIKYVYIFSRFMWAFWALSWSEFFFTEKTGNKARTFSPVPLPSPHPPLSLSPSYLFYICLYSSFLYSSCSISFLSFILISSFPLSSSSSSSSLLVCPFLFGSCLIL